MFKLRISLLLLVSIFSLSACSIISAPTESTTDTSSDASSEGTSDTTSSSSDGDDEKSSAYLEKFVHTNLSHLRSDMARGNGEYLDSLAVLLAIDDSKKVQFHALTKNRFAQLFVSPDTSSPELIHNLKTQIQLAQI